MVTGALGRESMVLGEESMSLWKESMAMGEVLWWLHEQAQDAGPLESHCLLKY